MMRAALLSALCALAVSACASVDPNPVPEAIADLDAAANATPPVKGPLHPADDKDTCGAAAYAGLIGKQVTSEGVPQPESLVRHIKPDSIITMELAPKRLNLYVSNEGIIQKLTCG